MQKSLILGAGLLGLVALPAFADGYKDAPPPNRGPEPLTPHAAEIYPEDEVQPVETVREEPLDDCCCCAPEAERQQQAYGGPVYQEGTVIWSSSGRYGAVPLHDDRADPWAHYNRGWRN